MRLLITVSDIAEYRDVTTNVPAKRITPMIREAQDIDLRELLGEKLYDKVVEDISPLNYPELDELIKPALCYWAYARIVKNNRLTITSNGVVNKNLDGSVQASDQSVSIAIGDARDNAIAYANRLITYLDKNASDYPEWVCRCEKVQRGSSRITAVGNNKDINDAVKDEINKQSIIGNRGIRFNF